MIPTFQFIASECHAMIARFAHQIVFALDDWQIGIEILFELISGYDRALNALLESLVVVVSLESDLRWRTQRPNNISVWPLVTQLRLFVLIFSIVILNEYLLRLFSLFF